jgi:hypothetical protein
MIIGEKKRHINRSLCAHCGKEMAREENKVCLEVRRSLKKSKSCYNPILFLLSIFYQYKLGAFTFPKGSFSYTFGSNNSSSISESESTTDIPPECVCIYIHTNLDLRGRTDNHRAKSQEQAKRTCFFECSIE